MNRRIVVCGVLAIGLAVGCKKSGDNAPKADPAAAAPDPAAKAVTEPIKPTKPVTEPAKPVTPAPDPKLLERGAYLAKAGGCLVCHTAVGPKGPDLEHALAGGFEMPDPAGTWRSPNITPDKGTGIGGWTDDQIARAIREGTRPDGSQLYAIMPYLNYNRLTDDDTKALVAFLRTVKPVERVIAPNKDLRFPQIIAPKPANTPDAVDDATKHGEYLSSVMLCNHCHWTPDAKFAPAGPDKMFSGGLPFEIPMLGKGKLFASNITSDKDTGIGKWTEDQIFTTIKTMVKPDGKQLRGPMMFLQGGWSQLDDKDLKAVAAYIHQLPAVKHKVPMSTFEPNATPAGPSPASDAPKGDAPKGDVPKGDAPKPKTDTKAKNG